MVLYLWPYQITKHYKNRGFGKHRGKPQMALLVAKVLFWEGALKGVFTIFDTQKLCSAENTIFKMFLAKHSFAEIKECKLKQSRNLSKNWGCLPTCKKIFCLFWCFGFSSLFCSFLCGKSSKKAIFMQL